VRRQSGLTINNIGSMFTIFQIKKPVRSFADAMEQDENAFAKQYRSMLLKCIYLPPSRFETAFVSVCHDNEDMQSLIK
jgi:glutamate-1-semialdehyde 2,1-aminomutase